jgi:hypothetical protein
MNWRLISTLSLVGFLIGMASVFGVMNGREWMAWLCLGGYSAWTFARRVREELFLHGFYLGILAGVLSSVVQALFVSTYLRNNPQMVEALDALPQGLHPSAVLLIMGPIVGTFGGVAFGLLALVAGKLVPRNT